MMKRDEIVSAIVEEMRKISSRNGYYTEAGKKVFEWLERPLGDEETESIIIRDPESASEANGWTSTHILTIEIDVTAAYKKDVDTLSFRMYMSDVIKAFGVVCDEVLNVIGEYKGSEVVGEYRGKAYASARLKFTVTYSTQKWEE